LYLVEQLWGLKARWLAHDCLYKKKKRGLRARSLTLRFFLHAKQSCADRTAFDPHTCFIKYHVPLQFSPDFVLMHGTVTDVYRLSKHIHILLSHHKALNSEWTFVSDFLLYYRDTILVIVGPKFGTLCVNRIMQVDYQEIYYY